MAAELPLPCIRECGRMSILGRRRCQPCLEKQRTENRRFYADRVARGQCPYCRLAAEVGVFCLKHWFKNVGVSHGLGSNKGIAVLRELWEEQNGRCAVTGVVLIPGSTASIDHIMPKSRGGSSEKNNLRWVLLRINQIKWDMSHEEFVEVCRTVVREQDRRDARKGITHEAHTRSN